MDRSSRRLADRVAVVTGAAHGIGEAIAARFAAEGARVVIGDLDGDGAKVTAERIASDGGTVLGLGVDVSRSADVAALAPPAPTGEWSRTTRPRVVSRR